MIIVDISDVSGFEVSRIIELEERLEALLKEFDLEDVQVILKDVRE
jgi:hypothetical protein